MNEAVNMAAYTAPKSDQLNADDLIAGPRTITITRVRANGGNAEQPVSIHFEGDNNKPYLPCKSMRRVMVHVWGADARAYVGRSMTLYCDPEVMFGGLKVGGIRISHMSHIDEPKSMPLTTTRSRRALFTVQPLIVQQTAARKSDVAAPTVDEYAACANQAAFDVLEKRRAEAWKSLKAPEKTALKAASDAAAERIRAAAAQPEPLTLSSDPVDTEAGAIAALEAAFKQGPDALKAEWSRIENDYAARKQPIPLAVDAKYSELNDAMKE